MTLTTAILDWEKAIYRKDLKINTTFWCQLREFIDDLDIVCGEIITNHQLYKKGDIVVLEILQDDDSLKIGLIETIVVKGNKVVVVTRNHVAVRQALGYFETVTSENVSCFTEVDNIVDGKPLILHGTEKKFQFVTSVNSSSS